MVCLLIFLNDLYWGASDLKFGNEHKDYLKFKKNKLKYRQTTKEQREY